MSQFNYDFLAFIGRFQPFHLGHRAVVLEGLKQARQLIILCGSAHQPPSVRNPWSVSEREQMIRSTLSAEQNERVHIVPLMDNVYNDEMWVRDVQATVTGLVAAHQCTSSRKPKVGLIGHGKDRSAYYLNLFPQWGSVGVENFADLSATGIREAFFADETLGDEFSGQLHNNVVDWLKEYRQSEQYQDIRGEHEFVQKYRSAWASAPYPPTFVTVDAVVVQSGHVLLVERKARPGRGLLALPGGFLDPDETLVEGCLRELREETRLKVPAPVLRGSIRNQHVFDDPYRSARGRTVTHAFYIELEPSQALPKVRGGDDARHAQWVPLAEVEPIKMFEDHYFIIQYFTGL